MKHHLTLKFSQENQFSNRNSKSTHSILIIIQIQWKWNFFRFVFSNIFSIFLGFGFPEKPYMREKVRERLGRWDENLKWESAFMLKEPSFPFIFFFFFFNIFFLVFEKENCNHNVDNKLGPSSRLQTVKWSFA